MPKNEEIISRRQIRRDFHHILSQQPDVGAAKIIRNCLFEPPNIFDPNRRRTLKAEILIVLSYVLLMAVVCAAFNFR